MTQSKVKKNTADLEKLRDFQLGLVDSMADINNDLRKLENESYDKFIREFNRLSDGIIDSILRKMSKAIGEVYVKCLENNEFYLMLAEDMYFDCVELEK